jgi:AhpD family alkylhydroperoxidase
MTHDRLDPQATAPDLYRAILGVERYVRSNVSAQLLHLVKLRASMTNGCAFCVDMHGADAQREGETTTRLLAVAAWEESLAFDERERAALALTDAVTDLRAGGVPDDVWAEAARHFDDKALLDLLGAIALINLWNRLAVTLRTTPLSARAEVPVP